MVFVYDTNLNNVKNFTMPREMLEGWGLVHKNVKMDDGSEKHRFFATDGSNRIFIIDPNSWKIERTI